MTTQIVGLDEARRQLSSMINGLDKNQRRYLLSARGRPRAVLMSISDYQKTILGRRRSPFVAEIQLEAKTKGLDNLALGDIQREIRAARRGRR